MSADQSPIKYSLALNRITSLGPQTYKLLINHFKDSPSVFRASGQDLDKLNINKNIQQKILNPEWDSIQTDLEWLTLEKNFIVTLESDQYPTLLKAIDNPPPVLYIHGNPECIHSIQLAIVGSRTPSATGKENAFRFAQSLAQSAITITSGLAYGIDAAAHSGALHVGGSTIAVMGSGLDRVYPGNHKALAHQIAESGALVSEFPINTPPAAENFPRRNRIISGLSTGCLVVEAALKSGSLITAHHALEQGREVFALPGSIHNPLSKGCHRLIKEGAKLVETSADIIEELGNLLGAQKINASTDDPVDVEPTLAADHKLVLDQMGYDRASIDMLVSRTPYNAEEISSMLLILELDGKIKSDRGGYYVRIPQQLN